MDGWNAIRRQPVLHGLCACFMRTKDEIVQLIVFVFKAHGLRHLLRVYSESRTTHVAKR